MTEQEKRVAVLTEMFVGFGAEAIEERIAYYMRLTKNVPIEYLRVACDAAACEMTTGFPPGPGDIVRAAEQIHNDIVKRNRRSYANSLFEGAYDGIIEEGKRLEDVI